MGELPSGLSWKVCGVENEEESEEQNFEAPIYYKQNKSFSEQVDWINFLTPSRGLAPRETLNLIIILISFLVAYGVGV